MEESIKEFSKALEMSIKDQTFVKMSLGNYHGEEAGLKNIYVKAIILKNEQKLSFTYRYQTKDIIKNYAIEEAMTKIAQMTTTNGFRLLTLFTLNFDLVMEMAKNNAYSLKKQKASHHSPPTMTHDKQKNRKIETADKPYLHELQITDKQGVVYKNAQDKFKQINHYVEILSSLLKELPNREFTNVVDMGAGKGYLTFALYDYLNNVLQKPAHIVGVEYRAELVNLCNTIAKKSNFDRLSFVQGSIEEYENSEMNVLIALHACDTATDDAIAKGITQQADLIVVAPCCHKQIRREIEKHKTENELDFLLKYGIFLERQAEMLTDSLRALILNYYGYATKIVEFVSDAHTPKNILIIAVKKQAISDVEKQEIANKIKKTKSFFGITHHHLEKIMGAY